MNKLKYIIVDDEPIAHEIIEDYGNDLQYLDLQANCYDAFQAMQFLAQHPIDLMFLDLNMPKLKGFEFLKTLQQTPQVIVTTAYSEFALEGYELDVVDYLLKPFSFERFVKAVNKLHTLTEPSIQVTATSNTKSRIFLKGDKKQHQVSLQDILYIEAYGNYSKVYLLEEMIVTSEKISAFEKLLPTDQFLRVHKSFIVAVEHIKLIEGNRITVKDQQVPIGKVYKLNVNRLFG